MMPQRGWWLVAPFAAYAAVAAVSAYRPVVGVSVPKAEPLPDAEEFARGRERCARIAAGYHALAAAAFRMTPEKPPEAADEARKLAAAVRERNFILDDVRAFGLHEPTFRSTLKPRFLAGR